MTEPQAKIQMCIDRAGCEVFKDFLAPARSIVYRFSPEKTVLEGKNRYERHP